jgi:pilus assembly protein Flp/PilA
MDSLKACLYGRQGFSFQGDRGATAVEYGLMASLIAVVIVVTVMAFGTSVKGLFELVITTAPFN